MAQYARDEAGNVWEVDAQGNAVRLAQPVSAPAPQPMTIGTPDPTAAYAAPKAAADLAAAQARAATAPYDARKAAADAAKAEADAVQAQRDLQAQQATANPKQQRAMADLANDEIFAAISKARQDLAKGMSAGVWARLPEMIQPQSAIDFAGSLNTVASRQVLDKLAAMKASSPTGASGLGVLTDKEAAYLRDSLASLGQTQSPERLAENLASVELHYRRFAALTNGEDYRKPEVAERYGIVARPDAESARPNALSQGGYRDEPDPALRGVNAQIRSMIGAGRPAAEIVGFMNAVRPGLGDEKAGDVAAAVRYRAQNPRVPLSDYAISVENRSVPMSGVRETLNTVTQMPLGAYAASAVDALTANNLHRAFDNPTLARAGINAIADENPTSSFLGTATGGALAGAGIEAALPFRAAGAAVQALRQPIADASYGAVASASDGGSALGGAVEGIAGGMVGRVGTRALGAGLRGVTNPDAQLLRARGVTMTLGQMLSQEGRFGAGIKAREDRLAGFGGIGDRINAQRRQSMIDMNRAAFNEAVPPTAQTAIGNYAEEGIEQLRDATRGTYRRALDGRVFDLTDPQFVADYGAARAAGGAIPRTGPEFAHYADERMQPFLARGQVSGREAQDVLQGFRDADFGTDAMGVSANNAAGQARDAFVGMIDRQAPDVMPTLREADTAYRNLNVLADAVGRGINTDGIFSGAQLGQAARANARRFNGTVGAATTQRPFYDLQRAAQNILPSKGPDSGTAGRMEAHGGVTAAIRSAVRNALNAPLYSDTLQPALNAAVMDRSPGVRRVGEEVGRRARLGGLFAAPLLVDYGSW